MCEFIGNRDFIIIDYLIGASLLEQYDFNPAEEHFQRGLSKCREINFALPETFFLLGLAKLRHKRRQDEAAASLAKEALANATRCGFILQEADIHLFLAMFWKDTDQLEKAKTHAMLAKLRSHQKINTETGAYITKDENTEYKYKPCFDEAQKLLDELNDLQKKKH